jgi:hypothetical protein
MMMMMIIKVLNLAYLTRKGRNMAQSKNGEAVAE